MAIRALGRDAYAGFAKDPAPVWGTPTLIGDRDGMELLEETAKSEIELIRDPSFNGSPVPFPGDAGNESVTGFINVNLKYEDKSLMPVAMVFGSAAAPIAEAALNKHVLRLAGNNDGQYGTLVIGRRFEVWEYDSTKPNKIELTCNPSDQFAKCVIDGIGRSLHRNLDATPGAVNTPTTFADATNAFDVKRLLKFSQLKVYMQDLEDDGLFDSNDEVCISDFTFMLERPEEGDRTTCNAGLVEEPSETDFAKIGMKWVIPAYSDAHGDLWDAGRSKVVKKALAEFKNVVDGTHTYRVSLFFPSVQLTNDGPRADNPGKLPFTINVDGFRATTVPDGFDFDDAVYAEIVNGFDGSNLLDEAAYA
jgi:hypothetical protein